MINKRKNPAEYFRFLADMGENELPMPGAKSGERGDVVAEEEKLTAEDKAFLLRELEEEAKKCRKCGLYKVRRKLVFGDGSPDAEILFVGEAPGAEEDRQGIPFVGRAGKLLDKILEVVGLKRSEVYIANVLKCRPPENRDPTPQEEMACLPFLFRQIEIIKPRIICCLGRISARALLHTKRPMTELRGKLFSFRGIPVVVTYHPAALLRNERLKKPTWDDFQFLLRELDRLRKENG